jgi:hypothetical protein
MSAQDSASLFWFLHSTRLLTASVQGTHAASRFVVERREDGKYYFALLLGPFLDVRSEEPRNLLNQEFFDSVLGKKYSGIVHVYSCSPDDDAWWTIESIRASSSSLNNGSPALDDLVTEASLRKLLGRTVISPTISGKFVFNIIKSRNLSPLLKRMRRIEDEIDAYGIDENSSEYNREIEEREQLLGYRAVMENWTECDTKLTRLVHQATLQDSKMVRGRQMADAAALLISSRQPNIMSFFKVNNRDG